MEREAMAASRLNGAGRNGFWLLLRITYWGAALEAVVATAFAALSAGVDLFAPTVVTSMPVRSFWPAAAQLCHAPWSSRSGSPSATARPCRRMPNELPVETFSCVATPTGSSDRGR